MPTYTFRNRQTDIVETKIMSIADREIFLKENPQIEQLIVSAPTIGDPMNLGLMKVPGSFNEVLRKIKSQNQGSTITSGNLSEV